MSAGDTSSIAFDVESTVGSSAVPPPCARPLMPKQSSNRSLPGSGARQRPRQNPPRRGAAAAAAASQQQQQQQQQQQTTHSSSMFSSWKNSSSLDLIELVCNEEDEEEEGRGSASAWAEARPAAVAQSGSPPTDPEAALRFLRAVGQIHTEKRTSSDDDDDETVEEEVAGRPNEAIGGRPQPPPSAPRKVFIPVVQRSNMSGVDNSTTGSIQFMQEATEDADDDNDEVRVDDDDDDDDAIAANDAAAGHDRRLPPPPLVPVRGNASRKNGSGLATAGSAGTVANGGIHGSSASLTSRTRRPHSAATAAPIPATTTPRAPEAVRAKLDLAAAHQHDAPGSTDGNPESFKPPQPSGIFVSEDDAIHGGEGLATRQTAAPRLHRSSPSPHHHPRTFSDGSLQDDSPLQQHTSSSSSNSGGAADYGSPLTDGGDAKGSGFPTARARAAALPCRMPMVVSGMSEGYSDEGQVVPDMNSTSNFLGSPYAANPPAQHHDRVLSTSAAGAYGFADVTVSEMTMPALRNSVSYGPNSAPVVAVAPGNGNLDCPIVHVFPSKTPTGSGSGFASDPAAAGASTAPLQQQQQYPPPPRGLQRSHQQTNSMDFTASESMLDVGDGTPVAPILSPCAANPPIPMQKKPPTSAGATGPGAGGGAVRFVGAQPPTMVRRGGDAASAIQPSSKHPATATSSPPSHPMAAVPPASLTYGKKGLVKVLVGPPPPGATKLAAPPPPMASLAAATAAAAAAAQGQQTADVSASAATTAAKLPSPSTATATTTATAARPAQVSETVNASSQQREPPREAEQQGPKRQRRSFMDAVLEALGKPRRRHETTTASADNGGEDPKKEKREGKGKKRKDKSAQSRKKHGGGEQGSETGSDGGSSRPHSRSISRIFSNLLRRTSVDNSRDGSERQDNSKNSNSNLARAESAASLSPPLIPRATGTAAAEASAARHSSSPSGAPPLPPPTMQFVIEDNFLYTDGQSNYDGGDGRSDRASVSSPPNISHNDGGGDGDDDLDLPPALPPAPRAARYGRGRNALVPASDLHGVAPPPADLEGDVHGNGGETDAQQQQRRRGKALTLSDKRKRPAQTDNLTSCTSTNAEVEENDDEVCFYYETEEEEVGVQKNTGNGRHVPERQHPGGSSTSCPSTPLERNTTLAGLCDAHNGIHHNEGEKEGEVEERRTRNGAASLTPGEKGREATRTKKAVATSPRHKPNTRRRLSYESHRELPQQQCQRARSTAAITRARATVAAHWAADGADADEDGQNAQTHQPPDKDLGWRHRAASVPPDALAYLKQQQRENEFAVQKAKMRAVLAKRKALLEASRVRAPSGHFKPPKCSGSKEGGSSGATARTRRVPATNATAKTRLPNSLQASDPARALRQLSRRETLLEQQIASLDSHLTAAAPTPDEAIDNGERESVPSEQPPVPHPRRGLPKASRATRTTLAENPKPPPRGRQRTGGGSYAASVATPTPQQCLIRQSMSSPSARPRDNSSSSSSSIGGDAAKFRIPPSPPTTLAARTEEERMLLQYLGLLVGTHYGKEEEQSRSQQRQQEEMDEKGEGEQQQNASSSVGRRDALIAAMRAEFYARVKQQQEQDGVAKGTGTPSGSRTSPPTHNNLSSSSHVASSSSSPPSAADLMPAPSEEEAALLKMLEMTDEMLAARRGGRRQQQQQQHELAPQQRAIAHRHTQLPSQSKTRAESSFMTSASPTPRLPAHAELYAPPTPETLRQLAEPRQRDGSEEAQFRQSVREDEQPRSPGMDHTSLRGYSLRVKPPLPSHTAFLAATTAPVDKSFPPNQHGDAHGVVLSQRQVPAATDRHRRRSSVTPPPAKVLAYMNSTRAARQERERVADVAPRRVPSPAHSTDDDSADPEEAATAPVAAAAAPHPAETPDESSRHEDVNGNGSSSDGDGTEDETSSIKKEEEEEVHFTSSSSSASPSMAVATSKEPSPLEADLAVQQLQSPASSSSSSSSSPPTSPVALADVPSPAVHDIGQHTNLREGEEAATAEDKKKEGQRRMRSEKEPQDLIGVMPSLSDSNAPPPQQQDDRAEAEDESGTAVTTATPEDLSERRDGEHAGVGSRTQSSSPSSSPAVGEGSDKEDENDGGSASDIELPVGDNEMEKPDKEEEEGEREGEEGEAEKGSLASSASSASASGGTEAASDKMAEWGDNKEEVNHTNDGVDKGEASPGEAAVGSGDKEPQNAAVLSSEQSSEGPVDSETEEEVVEEAVAPDKDDRDAAAAAAAAAAAPTDSRTTTSLAAPPRGILKKKEEGSAVAVADALQPARSTGEENTSGDAAGAEERERRCASEGGAQEGDVVQVGETAEEEEEESTAAAAAVVVGQSDDSDEREKADGSVVATAAATVGNGGVSEKRVHWSQEPVQEVPIPHHSDAIAGDEEEEEEEEFEVKTPPHALARQGEEITAKADSPLPRRPSPAPSSSEEEKREQDKAKAACGPAEAPPPCPAAAQTGSGGGQDEERDPSLSLSTSSGNGSNNSNGGGGTARICQVDAEAFLEKLNGLEALLLHRFPQYFELASSTTPTARAKDEEEAAATASGERQGSQGSRSHDLPATTAAATATATATASSSRATSHEQQRAALELVVRRPAYAPPQLRAPHRTSFYSHTMRQYGLDELAPLSPARHDSPLYASTQSANQDTVHGGGGGGGGGSNFHHLLRQQQQREDERDAAMEREERYAQDRQGLAWSPARIPAFSAGSLARNGAGSSTAADHRSRRTDVRFLDRL